MVFVTVCLKPDSPLLSALFDTNKIIETKFPLVLYICKYSTFIFLLVITSKQGIRVCDKWNREQRAIWFQEGCYKDQIIHKLKCNSSARLLFWSLYMYNSRFQKSCLFAFDSFPERFSEANLDKVLYFSVYGMSDGL